MFSTAYDLFTRTYAAFNARDIETVLSVIHPEVDWPNGMEGGRVYRQEGVREYWTRQWSAINPRVEPKGFRTDEDGNIIVDVHQVVRDQAGKVLVDQMVQHIYRTENGLITHMEIRTL